MRHLMQKAIILLNEENLSVKETGLPVADFLLY